MHFVTHFLLLALLTCFVAAQQDLTICSFNVQVFGVTKAAKPQVMDVLAKIFRRYDLCLIQEIRDSSNTAINDLLTRINNLANNTYSLVLSERLGRSTSKEQYGYFYRTAKLDIVQTYQFPVSFDWFERPPFSMLVAPKGMASDLSKMLFVSGNHIKPEDAVGELNRMVDAYDMYLNNVTIPMDWRNVMAKRWLFMGDLNAGCSYVPNSQWPNVKLRNQTVTYNGNTVSRFSFLISDTTKTTTAVSSSCPYDRFVSTLELNADIATNLPGSVQVIPGTPGIFNFTQAYGLDSPSTIEVSDHFPIALTIRNFGAPKPASSTTKNVNAAPLASSMSNIQLLLLLIILTIVNLV